MFTICVEGSKGVSDATYTTPDEEYSDDQKEKMVERATRISFPKGTQADKEY